MESSLSSSKAYILEPERQNFFLVHSPKNMATLPDLPTELKSLVISFCDFPTLVTLIRVNTQFHAIALPFTSDHDLRLQFLLDYESFTSNRIYHIPVDARQTVNWPENNQALWRSKLLYLCFMCEKLRLPDKFAGGQCWRMMLPETYSSERKRFCIDCGVKARKYVPGSRITHSTRDLWHDSGYIILLCGGCGEWTPDFYCMREKRCFICTEKGLRPGDGEKFVEGYEDGAGTSAIDWFAQTPEDKLKDPSGCPKRPPCCRSCGGHWRYTPRAFQYGSRVKKDKNYHFGYRILGKPKNEMARNGFYPYPPNENYRE